MHSTEIHTCIKDEVSNTNISGVTNMNMTKREQILLPNYAYLRYCLNYWCHYVANIDVCVKSGVYNTYISRVIDINGMKRQQIWFPNKEYFEDCLNYWYQYT